ncbi:tellurium resistance protein TerD [Paenibacillus sp. 1182]|uniref:TerD family protein n=1 Tax=Paenibacillus sp. 1182 TaxID=2806565 RepID=UPI001AE4187F|nr:TerD family protein [Paenibacillus sp. 1182]MBP1309238.1 tellurium resistance protein TerD [Paenibacillus sp. 1182]
MGIEIGGTNQGQGRTLTLGGVIPAAPTATQPVVPMLQLSKGEKLALVKTTGVVEQVRLGTGWDPNQMPGQTWDIDVTAIILDANGKSRMGKFVCFDQRFRLTEEGGIKHNGDNLSGKGEGIDETIDAFLTKLSPGDVKIKFFAHIFNGKAKGQHFGLIRNAFIQLDEINTGEKLARFSLTENYSGYTAIEFGELVSLGTAWQFNATGIGLNEECDETINRFM